MASDSTNRFYGWQNACFLFIVYFVTVGLIFYGFSAIFPVMIQEMGWKRAEASVAHTLASVLMGLLMPVVAVVLHRIGSRLTILAGLGILLLGLGLLSTVTTRLWQWIVIWGFFMPFGFAFTGILPLQVTINYWFNIKRGTVIGLVLSGGALGGFIAQPVFTWLMQLAGTWRIGWICGGILVVFAFAAAFRVRTNPQEMGQYPDGLTPEETRAAEQGAGKTAATYRTVATWKLKEAVRTRTLYLLLLLMIAQAMSLFMITSHGILHLTDLGYTKMQAASILGFIILGSGVARFPMGWLADRVEARWISTAAVTLMLVAFIGIWRAPNTSALMIFGPLFGFGYGTIIVMMSILIANYYGPDAFASINGLIGPIVIPFAAMVPVGAGFIADKLGSYDLAFICISVVLVFASLGSAMLKPPQKAESTAEGYEE